MNHSIALSLALFIAAAPAVLAAPQEARDRCLIEGIEFDQGAPGVVIYGIGKRPRLTGGVSGRTQRFVDLHGQDGRSCRLVEDRGHDRTLNHSLVKRIRYAPNRPGVVRVVVEATAPFQLRSSFKARQGGWVLRLPVIRQGKLAHASEQPRRWAAPPLPAPPRLRLRRYRPAASSPKLPMVPLVPFIPSILAHASPQAASPSLLRSQPSQVLGDWLLEAAPHVQTIPYQGDSPQVRIFKDPEGQTRIRLEGAFAIPVPLARPAGIVLIERKGGEIVVSFRSESATTSLQVNRPQSTLSY